MLPQRLLPRPSEDRLGLGIPFENVAGFVGLNERFESIGDDVSRHLLAFKQRFLRFLSRGNIARNLGGADDRSRLRPDRRDAEGHIDLPSIFAGANGFVVIDFFATSYSVQGGVSFAPQIAGNDDIDAIADRFPGGKSEHAFRGRIPAGDDAIEGFGHDCIVGRFHGCDEELLALEGATALFNLPIECCRLGARLGRHVCKRIGQHADLMASPGWQCDRFIAGKPLDDLGHLNERPRQRAGDDDGQQECTKRRNESTHQAGVANR